MFSKVVVVVLLQDPLVHDHLGTGHVSSTVFPLVQCVLLVTVNVYVPLLYP